MLAFHCLLLAFVWAIGPANKFREFLLACLLFAVVGCGCWRNVLIPPWSVRWFWVGCGAFLPLRGCPLAPCMLCCWCHSPHREVLSLLACVGFFQALDAFFPVPFPVSLPRSCWRFFFPSVFRSGSVSCSVAVRLGSGGFVPPVVPQLLNPFGLCPVVVACVWWVCCVLFLFPLFPP